MTTFEITEERYQQLDLALLRLQAVADLVDETTWQLPAEREQAKAQRWPASRDYHEGRVDGVEYLLNRLVSALATAPVAAVSAPPEENPK